MLWKNRDTSATDNVVDYIPGRQGQYSFVALFNAKDRSRREAWMGMNEVGFAVMNTASYNLKDDKVPQKSMDREGVVMARALKTCRTVDDFQRLLSTLPRPMGVEANFGVIDAYGNAAYFETNNHSFTRVDAKDTPGEVIVRTNYSHSGRPEEGYGFAREASACRLLQPYMERGEISPELFTETLSRSFYHDMLGRDPLAEGDRWAVDQDFIPRASSTATVVIEGCRPLKPGETVDPDFIRRQYIMWTGLGYPPCSEIKAVKCSEEGVEKGLRADSKTGRAPLCDAALERKKKVFPLKKGNGSKYVDLHALSNREETGFIQTLVPQNLETYRREKELRGE